MENNDLENQPMPEINVEEMSAKIDHIYAQKSKDINMPTHDEVEDFLSRVTNVNQQVKDIISGKISLDDVDREEYAKFKKEKTLK